MRRDITTSAIGIVVLTILLGIVYPLAMTGISQLVFKDKANGSLIHVNGKVVGSELIGQQFANQVVKNGKPQVDKSGNPVTSPDPRYFQSRPSATVPPYNGAASTFSNFGPNNVATKTAIDTNVQAYISMEKKYVPDLTPAKVPVDAANNSASGLDPDISQANARIQSHRIAAVRRLSLSQVDQLISKYTHGRGLGFAGEKGVNVLKLNLALDRLTGGHA